MVNEFLKSENFNSRHTSFGKTPITRLMGLCNAIEQWSQDKSSKNTEEAIEELSIEDVQALRELIENEVSSIRTNEPNIVTDQILFLIVGAVKVQAQSKSETTWPLVNQTINKLASPREGYSNLVYFSLISFVIIIGFAITLLSINSKNTQAIALTSVEVSQDVLINKVGSKIVNNLINVYHEMQSGDCQLPQAALLQAKDREAFIAFVTEGKVNISTAESLKKSLDYVDCNYPQKLMNNPLNIF